MKNRTFTEAELYTLLDALVHAQCHCAIEYKDKYKALDKKIRGMLKLSE